MLYFSKLKIVIIYFIIIFLTFFAFLNFIDNEENLLLSKKVNLGLDLQGGSYLLLEVDSQPVIKQKLQTKLISLRKILKDEKIIGVFCALLAVLIWSGFILVSRVGGMSVLTPYDVIAIRYATCAVLLFPVWLIFYRFNLFRFEFIMSALIGGLAYAIFAFKGFWPLLGGSLVSTSPIYNPILYSIL